MSEPESTWRSHEIMAFLRGLGVSEDAQERIRDEWLADVNRSWHAGYLRGYNQGVQT